MRIKLITVGLLFLFISNTIWAEAPVEDINDPSASVSASEFNETPADQEFVQRDENTTQNPKAGASVLLSKIEALEQQVQDLRGKLEVQAHDLKVLNDQQQAFYKDIDGRLSKQANRSEVKTHAEVIPAEPKVEPKKVTAESTTSNQTTVKTVAKDEEELPALNAPPSAGNQGDGERSYNAAYQLIKQKQYTEAISAFEAFLIAYPGSAYLANANYWLGELYLMEGHTDQALQAFTRVVQQYPKSSKAVGAQLKIGFAYYDKGQWKTARETLQKVASLYPDTSSARLATQRLQLMDQQGL